MIYNIFAWGTNSAGQLSLGYKSGECLVPTKVNIPPYIDPSKISKIIGGACHTIILTDKACYSCGSNQNGQLGNSSTDDSLNLSLVHIPETEKVIDVTCSWNSCMALTETGGLYVWGSNLHGQLGLDINIKSINKPFKLHLVEKIVKFAMGLRHSAVITEDGLLLVTGAGNKGQLGLCDAAGRNFRCIYKFTRVADLLDRVKDVSCGQSFTIVQTNEMDYLVCGSNNYGQFSFDTKTGDHINRFVKMKNITSLNDPASKIVCGWTHCLRMTGEGRLSTWGRNTYGQLGRGDKPDQAPPGFIETLTNVTQISAGSEHNVVVTSENEILTWGWNEHGNCGDGETKDVFIPTKLQVPCKYNQVKLIGSGAGHSFVIVKIN